MLIFRLFPQSTRRGFEKLPSPLVLIVGGWLSQLSQVIQIGVADWTLNHPGVELDIVPVGCGEFPAQVAREIRPAEATQLSSPPDLADRVAPLVPSFEQERQLLPQRRGFPHSPLHLRSPLRGQGFIEIGQKVSFREVHEESVTRSGLGPTGNPRILVPSSPTSRMASGQTWRTKRLPKSSETSEVWRVTVHWPLAYRLTQVADSPPASCPERVSLQTGATNGRTLGNRPPHSPMTLGHKSIPGH